MMLRSNSAQLANGRSFGALTAAVRALFANGEAGAWYDPSDFSTMFQEHRGSIAAAVGQPIGLMLDKTAVAGPELWTGVGVSVPAGWVDNGAGSYTHSAGVDAISSNIGLVAGVYYRIEFVLSGRTAGGVYPVLGGSADGANETVDGAKVQVFASGVNALLYLQPSNDFVGTISNISVRSFIGNHALQATSAARPVLAAGSKIDYDAVDDLLVTTFPDLGADVTIARSVPGTGASILTGQTIGAGAWNDSADHHGLIIVNRALTAAETAAVTRYLDAKAGV